MRITHEYNIAFSIETIIASEEDAEQAGVADAKLFQAYTKGLAEGANS